MPTATVHLDNLGGYAGPARCYRLDPPYQGHDYVTVWVQSGYGQHMRPEAALVPATETGASAEASLMRRPGSFVLHDEPLDAEGVPIPDKFDGACALALQMLGGYQIAAAP